MLSAIKELGEMIIEVEQKTPLEVFVQDPNKSGDYTKVITINFTLKNSTVNFTGVEFEEYTEDKIIKYLYRKGSGSGSDYTPTAKLTDKSEGTFSRKILGWFKILDDKRFRILQKEDEIFLESIKQNLEQKSNIIKKEIIKIKNNMSKNDKMFITLKFNDGDKLYYIGDFNVFKTLLIEQIKVKDSEFAKADKTCSICGKRSSFILGNLDVYAFYTLDKPGYITGDFDKSKAWRNFPVCSKCRLALEEGKKYIESYLDFKFCGIPYNIIPKFIFKENFVRDEVINIFANTEKIVSLRKRVIDRLTTDENDIFDILKDFKDMMTFDLLFIKRTNSAERILLVIEDVLPSRLRRIFCAKHSVDEVFSQSFTFGAIRYFFLKSDSDKRDTDLDGYFLGVVDRIFKDRSISRSFIFSFIMKKIRYEFVKEVQFYFAVINGLQVIYFLSDLNLIKVEVDSMEQRIFDNMFNKYSQMFKTPLKRGLFLLGSLTEMLLRKQYTERGAKPFIKNLKSLKMTERDFKGLLPKVQNKLEEYDSFDKGKRQLASEVANYLLLAGDDWTVSVDELNFYFAAGMNLTNEVAKVIYLDKEIPEDVIQKE